MLPTLLALLSLGAEPRPVCHGRAADTCTPDDGRRPAGARGATDTLGRGAWLIDEENDELLLVTPLGIARRVAVGAWPEQLVVESSGRVFVSCRQGGRVDVVGEDFSVTSLPVGPEPRALALDEERRRLYVGTVTGRQVVSFDTRTLTPLAWRDVPLPVTALAVTSFGLALGSDRSAELSFYPLDLDGPAFVSQTFSGNSLPWFSDTAQVRVQWLATSGDSLWVIVREAHTGTDAPSSSSGYGGAAGATHLLVVHQLTHLSQGLGGGHPASLFESPDVSAVSVQSGRLSIASRTRGLVNHVTAKTWTPVEPEGEPLSRSFSPAFFKSSDLNTGVSAMAALDDGRLVVLEPDARELGVITVPERQSKGRRQRAGVPSFMARITSLPAGRLDPELQLGRALFHDADNARLSHRLMSCAHCHVDGREDGLVWEQNGTLRQTPMLAGHRLADTAPYNWLGTAPTLEANIRQTVEQRLDGEGLKPRELDALARYVREGLRPVTRPVPAVAPAVLAQGRAVFESPRAGCASCHPADFEFTDGEQHDVRSVGAAEKAMFETAHPSSELLKFSQRLRRFIEVPKAEMAPRRFNTPALAFVGGTAPYLHDGSASTLDALIAKNHDRMGSTSQLSPDERTALVAYLQSL